MVDIACNILPIRAVDVQRLLISNKYFVSSSSAFLLGMRLPQYSRMNVPFLMGSVANSPRPVLERPTRNGPDDTVLRGTGRSRSSSIRIMHVRPAVGRVRVSRSGGRWGWFLTVMIRPVNTD